MQESLADEWFQNLFEYSPIPIEIYNEHGELQKVNTACLDLFGVHSMEEIKGFKLFEDPNLPEKEKARIKKGSMVKYTSEFDFKLVKERKLYNTSKSGKKYLEVLIKPLFFTKDHPTPTNYAVYVQDITSRMEAELEKTKILEHLRDSVKEKDLLMKEIHHRVKNNLQVISSLIILQNRSIKDVVMKKKLNEFLNRVKSISLNHDYLFSSKHLGKIDFKKYSTKLCENILTTYDHQFSGIQIRIEAQKIYLDVKEAQVCGMILNELITNALKHAFPSNKGEILISFSQSENSSKLLLVKDDGIGFSPISEEDNPDSFGLRLVRNLVKQIGGKIEFTENNGTEIRIYFLDL